MNIVYITTNLINGKKYIGSHVGNNPNYLGSGVYLNKAIKKYGRKNFKRETLVEVSTIKEMKMLEEYYINYYNAYNSSLFYNGTKYAAGITKYPEDKKINVSKANKGNLYNLGRKQSLETIEKRMSKVRGQKFSEESKQKIRESKLGNKYALGNKFTQDQKDKISKSKKGHICYKNPERSRKISLSKNKLVYQYDKNFIFIKEWESGKIAAKKLGINYQSLNLNLNNHTKSSGGFIWKYK